MDFEVILRNYTEAMKHTKEPTAAALLVLAGELSDSIRRAADIDSVSHSLCMGIRKGLCGADAGSHKDPLAEIAEAIASRG